MVTVEEYYGLPYSSQPSGWKELTEEQLQELSSQEVYSIMEDEDYTRKTRFVAAVLFLSKTDI